MKRREQWHDRERYRYEAEDGADPAGADAGRHTVLTATLSPHVNRSCIDGARIDGDSSSRRTRLHRRLAGGSSRPAEKRPGTAPQGFGEDRHHTEVHEHRSRFAWRLDTSGNA